MQKTLFIKLSIIAGLCLIFAVGLSMIGSLIYERQQYSENVISEIAQQHVNPQQVITPFIAIPTTVTPKCIDDDTSSNQKTPDVTNKKSKCRPYTVIESLFATTTVSTQNLNVDTNTYKRGIYHATSYNGDLIFDQNYTFEKGKIIDQNNPVGAPNTTGLSTIINSEMNNTTIHWDKARLMIPVSDLRGVTTLPTVTINKSQIKTTYPKSSILSNLSYVEAPLPASLIDQFIAKQSKKVTNSVNNSNNAQSSNTATNTGPLSDSDNKTSFKVLVKLPLSGISTLNTVPTGQNFELNMRSNWHAPNFIGQALPVSKEISKAGFNANWQNQYLTIANNQRLSNCLGKSSNDCQIRTYAPLNPVQSDYDVAYRYAEQAVRAADGANAETDLSGFGVSFAEPNDVYLQTERTMKYALLLILVSFGTFFLFEVIKSSRIHPIQYLLVGCALVTFYVLLLPLAEQIPFWMAYVVAATACVGLIGWYSYYMLGSVKRGLMFTAILGSLYAAFYGILTTEDLNLLLGALFCFALLACVMIMTRKIDWYNVA